MADLNMKLANAKVQDIGLARIYLIDKAKTSDLYDSIKNDEFFIPSAYLIVLQDGVDKEAVLSLGGKWSEGLSLSAPAADGGGE